MANQNEILAKLLVDDNKSIRWVDDKNPLFDPEEGVVEIPYIKRDVHDVGQLGWILANICHLLTHNHELWEKCKKKKIPREIYSFVNQVRSERVMKKLYPGSERSLTKFWQWLRDHSGFSITEEDGFIKKYLVYDKLSIYEIIHIISPIKRYIVDLLDNMKTDDDFLHVCEELTKFADIKEYIASQNPANFAMKTQSSFMKGMDQGYTLAASQFAAQSDDNRLIKKFNPYLYSNIIEHNILYQYEDVLQLHDTQFINQSMDDKRLKIISDFRKKGIELVSAFQERQSAMVRRKTRYKDEGDIDHNKLWSYMIDNDILLTEEFQNDGENHGLVFMLDLSSSMIGSKLKSALEQMIILAIFCRFAGIKHEFLAFSMTDGGPIDHLSEGYITPPIGMRFYELFNNNMSPSEFDRMIRIITLMYLTSYKRGQIITELEIGKTPLLNSLCYAPHICSQLKSSYSLEKVALMFISDGETDPLSYVKDGEICSRERHNKKIEIFDESTLDFYEESQDGILKMMRNFDPDIKIYGIVPVVVSTDISSRMFNNDLLNYKLEHFIRDGYTNFNVDPYDNLIFIKDRSSLYGFSNSESKAIRSFHNTMNVNTYSTILTREFINDYS